MLQKFSFVIILCLFQAFLLDQLLQTNGEIQGEIRIRRQASTTKKPVACSTLSFTKIFPDCAKPPPFLDFFNNSILLSLNKNQKDDKLFNFLKTFVLNSYMTSKLSNATDFVSNNAAKELSNAACFAVRAFEKVGAATIDGDEIQVNWDYFYDRATVEVWKQRTQAATSHCRGNFPWFPVRQIRDSTGKICSLEPLLVFQCSIRILMVNIPAKYSANTTACNTSIQSLKQCDPMPGYIAYPYLDPEA